MVLHILEPEDFEIIEEQLLLTPNSPSGRIIVRINGDDIAETREELVLEVRSNSDRVQIEPDSITLIIDDDDEFHGKQLNYYN